MNGWGWLGAAGAGVLAIGALLWFTGVGRLAAIWRALLDIVSDAAAGMRDWLRVKGNPTRLLCGVFALAFMSAGLQSWQRGTTIVQQRAEYVALQERTRDERARFDSRIEARDTTIRQFVALAEHQRRLLAIAEQQATAAVADADRAKREAAEAAKRYEQRFDERPPECEAALQVMAQACPTLSDY